MACPLRPIVTATAAVALAKAAAAALETWTPAITGGCWGEDTAPMPTDHLHSPTGAVWTKQPVDGPTGDLVSDSSAHSTTSKAARARSGGTSQNIVAIAGKARNNSTDDRNHLAEG